MEVETQEDLNIAHTRLHGHKDRIYTQGLT